MGSRAWTPWTRRSELWWPGDHRGGLLFIAATPDSKFRAFDKMTGELLWESELPAAGFATPSTYEAGGRQFIVVAAGGGKLRQPSGSRYVAYALPAAPAR